MNEKEKRRRRGKREIQKGNDGQEKKEVEKKSPLKN